MATIVLEVAEDYRMIHDYRRKATQPFIKQTPGNCTGYFKSMPPISNA